MTTFKLFSLHGVINVISFCIIVLLFNSCIGKENIEGLWSIHWVSTPDKIKVDTLEIINSEIGYEIELYNKREKYNPVYTNVYFDGNELKYNKNVNGITNYYKLQLIEKGNSLYGWVKTWQAEEYKIKLKRIQKNSYN
jgi:hypothetical protein